LGQTAATSTKEELIKKWNVDEYWDIYFAVHKSRRYHSKMQAFYQWASDLVLASNSLLGTAAFVALLGGKSGVLVQVLVGIVAGASALDTAFKWSRKTRTYSELSRRFTELAAKIEEWPPTPANYRKASSERVKIEKDEPPVRRIIDIMARNEELRASGLVKLIVEPSWLQRHFGYMFTFGLEKLGKERDNKQEDFLAADND
jgi:hypothetical protein